MAELVAVNPEAHQGLHVAHGAVNEQAARQHIIGLRAVEVGKVAGNLPIFVTRNSQSGDLALSAVTSFTPSESLMVIDGEWRATYLPTGMQTYPFFLMNAPEEEKGYAVGIQESNPAFSRDGGDALYDGNGKATSYLNNVTAQLEADIRNDIQSRQFLERTEALGLLKSVDLQVHYAAGPVNGIRGLNTIDEDVLQGLEADLLKELHGNGYLMILHALLISSFQLNTLIRRHNEQKPGDKISQIKLETSKDSGVA